jgi:hypothetical protein
MGWSLRFSGKWLPAGIERLACAETLIFRFAIRNQY